MRVLTTEGPDRCNWGMRSSGRASGSELGLAEVGVGDCECAVRCRAVTVSLSTRCARDLVGMGAAGVETGGAELGRASRAGSFVGGLSENFGDMAA